MLVARCNIKNPNKVIMQTHCLVFIVFKPVQKCLLIPLYAIYIVVLAGHHISLLQ